MKQSSGGNQSFRKQINEVGVLIYESRELLNEGFCESSIFGENLQKGIERGRWYEAFLEFKNL